MKNSILLALLLSLFSSLYSTAQILENPSKWRFSLEKTGLKPHDTTFLTIEVVIDDKWYLYSNDFDPELGPMVTTVYFKLNETFALIDTLKPEGQKRKFDDIWGGYVSVFYKKAIFRQKIVILKENYTISGTYEYQVCSDIDGKCIPYDGEFSIKNAPKSVEKPADKSQIWTRDSHDPYSLLTFFLIAFLGGLTALFTPCVFPLIPMTVSYFTKHVKKKMAIVYGISIILIYTLIGVLIAPIMGPETANELATHWLANVLFFVIFVIFGLSFLGWFEINLPNSWVNAMDQRADKGGWLGVFFMAFTLVLVSFSCTGPIVGSILVESAGGQKLKPIVGMLGFSAAFAIPFTLFALFPSWLSKLPKSGSWLTSIKVTLGFLELALALKFLSIADLAYHWGILDREVFLSLWIVIFGLLGVYYIGKLPLHGEKLPLTVPRLTLAILVFAFVVYLIPGLFGAPLKTLSGYLPPQTTLDFDLSINNEKNYKKETTICESPKYSNFLHFPHGLSGYFDYNQAIACAKEMKKPIFVDFTGHGCVNCREMEARVWSDPEILKLLNENFIMLALYVDDKTELPESEWITSKYDGKIKKTIGKKNADFQITRFQNNAQPFYMILNENGESLVIPKAYDLNIINFKNWLKEGIGNF